MSQVTAHIPTPGRHDRTPHGGERLWPALSRPFIREQPAQGLDLMGERLRSLLSRRRAGKAERRRAEAVVQAAGALSRHSEAAFDEAVADARARIGILRGDPGAVEAVYAVAHEAIRRELGLSLFVEQVMGALAMAKGCCAEMATGEGKTVTAILPAALEGWSGRGVHVVTVNDYLARRDAHTTGAAYKRLGLTVGVIQDQSTNPQRRAAYACSVTYAADKQVIFDFLRDRLVSPLQPRMAGLVLEQLEAMDGLSPSQRAGPWAPEGSRWSDLVVQRGLNAAIVDEADSVLIDEAITPAIIGQDVPGAGADQHAHYRLAAKIAAEMEPGSDYHADARMRRVHLTERGREKLARAATELPPFWAGPRRREELIVQALTARALYHANDDYIVREGKIVIVDKSTGRILDGRQWQLGVHQAIEAKENAEITDERRTTARISYQRFFQRYARLCGMTGTGWEVSEELWRYYRLPVVKIPTHKPVVRTLAPDHVFLTEGAKFARVAARVAEFHAQGRPVLVGTRSVIASERLGGLLGTLGVPCRILNATREKEEADIIAQAGQVGAVTVATNMAGRGTDILLSERTRALGGLVVIATERHDEARVDRQLFGRAGRQGDPGHAEVYTSLEDLLIVQHGLKPLVALVRALGGPRQALAARILWRTAQWASGRRAAIARGEVAKAEAWFDMAMHHHTR
jgi:preprotein translocase subunit SecA